MDGNNLPTIFIGSSSEARPLVEQLVRRLEESKELKALPWFQAFEVGFGTLEEL